MQKQILFGVIMGLAVFSLGTSDAFAAGYAKIGDIRGESIDEAHKDWIDILSFSFSVDKTISQESTARTRTTPAIFSDIVLVKELDASSPKLLEAASLGTTFKSMNIHLVAGDARIPYLSIELRNAMVSGYSISGSTSMDLGPTKETISLHFGEMIFTYDKVDRTGKSSGKTEFRYNVLDAQR